ncbi:DUF134 domain-containing protein [Malaciobacter marinus]|uniref:DUF134 domain-containing protein n=1 Tax=Malaciobacter marinus TaxID=505249 RepID=UPI003B007813
MNCCGRKRKSRNINADYCNITFKPAGIRRKLLETVIIYEDEMESIRLADYESMYHQDCANKMNISRSTFSRLIESARKKIADALLNQKAISVESRIEG